MQVGSDQAAPSLFFQRPNLGSPSQLPTCANRVAFWVLISTQPIGYSWASQQSSARQSVGYSLASTSTRGVVPSLSVSSAARMGMMCSNDYKWVSVGMFGLMEINIRHIVKYRENPRKCNHLTSWPSITMGGPPPEQEMMRLTQRPHKSSPTHDVGISNFSFGSGQSLHSSGKSFRP